jgi:hypothetical protein
MKNSMKYLHWICRSTTLAMFAFALLALGMAGSALAAIPVTTLDDSGPGSLRQAIADAVAGDTITFNVHGTIVLTSGALTIDEDLNIEGPGPYHLRISGSHASRVFVIQSGKVVTLTGMTISDGLADVNSLPPASVGGGILNGQPPLNFGTSLTLADVVLSGNQALGNPYFSFNYPGAAYGGGIANFGTLQIIASSFIDNVARGADGISTAAGAAGFGGGGVIFSVGKLTVVDSTFIQNQAIGGDNNESPVLAGHAFGGAIVGGGPLGDVVVQESEFSHNFALGGNGNISPAPASIGANKASGGAVDIVGGKATFDGCTFEHNLSVGGASGSGYDGGIGSGGALMSTNFNGQNTNVTVINSNVEHNKALGGPGSAGSDGGEGSGGGLTSTAGGILTVIDTTVAHNHAQGGQGGDGGNGGSGLGGGLFDNYNSPGPPPPPAGPTKLILEGVFVTKNLALGGEAGSGGINGSGIGGGVYYLGEYSADVATVIEKNQATTSNKNVGP